MDLNDTTTVSNHSIHVIDGRTVFVHVVDTPLQDDHFLVRQLFFKPAHCFMLVYDITCRVSFEKIVEYRNQLLASKGLSSDTSTGMRVPMVLVGNNLDCEDGRQVSIEEGGDLAKLLHCPHIETSSITGTRIEIAFRQIVHAVRDPGRGYEGWLA